MSSAVLPARNPGKSGLFQVVDWRLVAAIGLPVWAFLFGVVVMGKPVPPPPPVDPIEVSQLAGPNGYIPPPALQPPQPQSAPVEPVSALREVVRPEVVTAPITVPIRTPSQPVTVAEPVEPVEFRLPASEVLPVDRCKTFDTKIRFHAGLPEAADEAKKSKKMLLVLHISGNFDDPGFT